LKNNNNRKSREYFNFEEILKHVHSPQSMKLLGAKIKETVRLVEKRMKLGKKERLMWQFMPHQQWFTVKKTKKGTRVELGKPGAFVRDCIEARVALYEPAESNSPDLDGKVLGEYSEVIYFDTSFSPGECQISVTDFYLKPLSLADDIYRCLREKKSSRYDLSGMYESPEYL
jgi:hypothetical protein